MEPKFQYRIHKNLPLDKMNPLHVLTSNSFKILHLQSGLFPSDFAAKI
jgi:hypothetical protein